MTKNVWEMTEYEYCLHRQHMAEGVMKEANAELEHWKKKVREAWAKQVRADNNYSVKLDGDSE